MKKKTMGTILLSVFVLAIFCSPVALPAFAAGAEVEKSTGYNIVFVVDTSLSLIKGDGRANGTDPQGLRYEALGKMLSWLPGTNSRAGIVTFNREAITYKTQLQPIESLEDTEELLYYVEDRKLDEWTNITEAVESALEFFPDTLAEREQKGLDNNLPNLVMLFTDGVIDLRGGTSAESTSARRLKTLARDAKEKGVQVACIALNCNGAAESDKLREISELSGSTLFREVRQAEGLAEAFEGMHSLLFSSDKFDLKEGEHRFTVKPIGSLSLTITLTQEEEIELVSPRSKTIYTTDDARAMREDLYVIQIPNPESGSWKYKLSGEEGMVKIPTVPEINAWVKLYNALSAPLPTGVIGSVASAIPALIVEHLIKNKGGAAKFIFWISALVYVPTAFCFVFRLLCPGVI